MEIISDFACGGDDILVYPNGDKGEIALVQLHTPTGRPFLKLRGHLNAVTSVIYRRKHCQIVSAGKDGMIYIWDSSLSDREREEEIRGRERYPKRSNIDEIDGNVQENYNEDNWSEDENDYDNNNNYDEDNYDNNNGVDSTYP